MQASPIRPTSLEETTARPAALLDVRDLMRRVGHGRADVRGPVRGLGRGLSRAEACQLFGAMLDGELDDLELGSLLVALRMKGESLDELEGALAALQQRVRPIGVDPDRPVVSIPSYRGARHSADLTPLLACLLAHSGVQVIIHGVRHDPRRVTTCDVLRAMGLPPAASVADAAFSLELGNPAFVPIDVLCPSFDVLLQLRDRLGVRHLGHTLAKLVDPVDVAEHGVDHCVRLISLNHPVLTSRQQALLERSGARAVVMRGTGGESVADVRGSVRVDWTERGVTRTLAEADSDLRGRHVVLPPAQDAVATAAWVQSALAGEQPVPAFMSAQVDLILAALAGPPPVRPGEARLPCPPLGDR